MNYYRVLNDLDVPNRWFLGEVDFETDGEFWNYVKAGEIKNPPEKLAISVSENGIPLEFTMADFELLIVNEKVASFFKKDEVQLIPVKIRGIANSNNYYIAVVKKELDCVNKEKSEFEIWKKNNDIRPDKAGQYKAFFKLVVNAKQIQESELDILRIKNYNVALIVSEKLKKKFEASFVKGIKYQLVV